MNRREYMTRGSALVTGASGGLGAALADELARRRYPLVLTARNRLALEDVARRIRDAHGVPVTVYRTGRGDALNQGERSCDTQATV